MNVFKITISSIIYIYSGISVLLFASNPIVPYVGMADPHIKIYNNKAYMYATHDADSTKKDFIMPDWKIWSSTDLINWTLERTIDPTETYVGKSEDCWATDCVFKNGTYYFYFSNGNKNTGVLTSKSPTGPFTDILKKPLLSEELTTDKEYDPTVLVDDDKEQTAYIAFGHYSVKKNEPNLFYHIIKLNNDMISTSEEPKKLEIIGDIKKFSSNDKPTLHKYNGLYYLSAGSYYATSKNIYGPYEGRGNSGNNQFGLSTRAHGNYFEWNNQTFHVWCHFHLGKAVARYRESYLNYFHYKDNGDMVDDTLFLKAHFANGVGQYDALWDKIEAEWFMTASNISKRESPNGGFEIQNIKNGDYISFPNVRNLKNVNSVNLKVSATNNCTIEIRVDNENGKIIGTCEVSTTGSFSKYNTVNCKISTTNDLENLYFVFKGNTTDFIHVDWLNFATKK